jgi:hypothetical protein
VGPASKVVFNLQPLQTSAACHPSLASSGQALQSQGNNPLPLGLGPPPPSRLRRSAAPLLGGGGQTQACAASLALQAWAGRPSQEGAGVVVLGAGADVHGVERSGAQSTEEEAPHGVAVDTPPPNHDCAPTFDVPCDLIRYHSVITCPTSPLFGVPRRGKQGQPVQGQPGPAGG